MIDDIGTLIELIGSLEIKLAEYSSLTNLLSATDAEDVDEITRILEERGVLLADIKILEPQIIELIDLQVEENSKLIMKMFAGEAIINRLTDEQRLLQQKVTQLRSVQKDILTMDENNELRFRRKYDEIKDAMIELQNDKKKINFYENAKFDTKGDKFNSLN